MNNTYRNSLILTIAFVFIMLVSQSAEAQIRQIRRPPVNIPVAQSCQAVPQVYIRNLRYDDYTRYSRLVSSSVVGGGWLQINTNCLQFDGQIVVTLQDASRGDGYGVTAFRLTNVRFGPNVVMAQIPNYPMFRNRTFHVGLFVYGQPLKTANPGAITIQ